jgi:hypothetical protein
LLHFDLIGDVVAEPVIAKIRVEIEINIEPVAMFFEIGNQPIQRQMLCNPAYKRPGARIENNPDHHMAVGDKKIVGVSPYICKGQEHVYRFLKYLPIPL